MNRVRSERKRFFFESSYGPSLEITKRQKNRFALALDDIRFLVKWFLNMLLIIKHFGRDIQREYGVSRIKQFWQMSLLLLKHRVMPVYYRSYRLFKPEIWNRVEEFVYFHTASQIFFTNKLFPEESDLFRDKYLFMKFCRKHGFRTPEILVIFENGKLQEYDDVTLPQSDLFIKQRAGMKGMDAMLFRYQNRQYCRNGKSYSAIQLMNHLREKSLKRKALILQRRVLNHKSWMPFTSGALATCRIVTIKDPDSGCITPLSANLRLPVGKMEVDNTSAGALASPVDLDSGRLGIGSCINSYKGRFEFSTHPDTHKRFEGELLPYWDQILKCSIELHASASSPFIGWDITMSEAGCMVMEGSLVWSGGVEAPGTQPLKDTDYPFLYEKWLRLAKENRRDLPKEKSEFNR